MSQTHKNSLPWEERENGLCWSASRDRSKGHFLELVPSISPSSLEPAGLQQPCSASFFHAQRGYFRSSKREVAPCLLTPAKWLSWSPIGLFKISLSIICIPIRQSHVPSVLGTEIGVKPVLPPSQPCPPSQLCQRLDSDGLSPGRCSN